MRMNVRVFGKDTAIRPCVATIGSFDGVHLGHQHVIAQVVELARKRGLDAMIVTFPNHPRQVLQPDFVPQLLTTTEEKKELLMKTEADKVAMIDFTEELAQMTAREFMYNILKKQLQTEVLLIGYDNRFGHDGKRFDDYVEYGKEYGIEVVECGKWGKAHSSTTVRKALLAGDIKEANSILGYNYCFKGVVVEGYQNGRKIGYPTANLQVEASKLIPKNGVYLVKTDAGFGMLNIGTRPTLHNGKQRSIEVHIFDFENNLYGKSLKIEFLEHLRDEQEFNSIDMLRHQLAEDEQECRLRISKTDLHIQQK